MKKQLINYKADVKIPSLFRSIFDQSTTSTRLMQIYRDVGVTLLRSKYTVTLKIFLWS